MCGFTGFINLNDQKFNGKVLESMTDIQSHRGPDDRGLVGFSLFKDKKVKVIEDENIISENLNAGIGFNRLSILDLSKNGHQLISSCGTIF